MEDKKNALEGMKMDDEAAELVSGGTDSDFIETYVCPVPNCGYRVEYTYRNPREMVRILREIELHEHHHQSRDFKRY